MRIGYLILCFSICISTFSKEITYEGSNYIIKELGKGYFNYFILDKDNNKVPSLEDGSLINSRIFIKDGDSYFYLRSIKDFKYKADKNSLVLMWNTENLDIVEEYLYMDRSVNYSITLKNKAGRNRNVGAYLIYNTYLGEENKSHFLIDNYLTENRERYYEYGEIPLSIKSLNENGLGIEFSFTEDGTVTPDQLILGNWEKLARSKKWPYLPQKGGAFSYGYYSINDSALGIVYRGKNIKGGDSIKHSFNLSFISNREAVVRKLEPEEAETNITESAEKVIPELPQLEEIPVKEPDLELPEVKIDDSKPLDPEKEELLRMLEYIQKKKRGEDVSGYDFDENYIIEKLKERDE